MNNTHYYTPSGKAPAKGIVIMLAGGFAAALLLSILYIALQWFIPFIYLNFLIALGVAMALAFTMRALIKTGKIRSYGIAIVTGFIISVFAWYAQWSLFASLMVNAENNGAGYFVKSSFNLNTFMSLLLHPKLVFQCMAALNEVGTFTLKHNSVTGGFLWFVWIVEAVCIIIPGPLAGCIAAKEPYSETYDTWMTGDRRKTHYSFITDKEAFTCALESGNHHILGILKEGAIPANQYSELVIYSHPGESDCFISLENVTITRNKKGEDKKSKKDVIRFLCMPLAVVYTTLGIHTATVPATEVV